MSNGYVYNPSNPIYTNDLKKGAYVTLRNGWNARIADNLKGNTRMATVYGTHTETGSVYAYDIVAVHGVQLPDNSFRASDNGSWFEVTHTDKQLKVKSWNDKFFS